MVNLFIAILLGFWAFAYCVDKEKIMKGRKIFKPILDNPNGTLTKNQVKNIFMQLIDCIF